MNISPYRIRRTRRHDKQRSFPYPSEYLRVAAHAIIRIEGWKDILCRLSPSLPFFSLSSVTEEVNCRRQVGPDVKKFNVSASTERKGEEGEGETGLSGIG